MCFRLGGRFRPSCLSSSVSTSSSSGVPSASVISRCNRSASSIRYTAGLIGNGGRDFSTTVPIARWLFGGVNRSVNLLSQLGPRLVDLRRCLIRRGCRGLVAATVDDDHIDRPLRTLLRV